MAIFPCLCLPHLLCLNFLPGTSLEVQWLRLHTSKAGGVGSIPGGETKIPQVCEVWPKDLKKKKKKGWGGTTAGEDAWYILLSGAGHFLWGGHQMIGET